MKALLKLVIAVALLVVLSTLPASAQEGGAVQADDLQKQLQNLKQQYEATTHELEQRIAALESQIQKQKQAIEKAQQGTTTTATVEQVAQEAIEQTVRGQSSQVGAKFQGQIPSEPTYDLLREAETKIEKLKEQVGAFEFHGYFRSGYG